MKTNDQITDSRSNKSSVTSETDVSKIISVLGDKINTSDLLSAIMELAVKPVENSGDEQMNKLAFIKNCFNGTTPEIKKFYGDKDLYFCFIPAKMRKEGLPRRIVGKTEEVVIDKLFAALKGQDIKGKSKVVTFDDSVRRMDCRAKKRSGYRCPNSSQKHLRLEHFLQG